MDAGAGYTLAHPLYLDVPMMVSFLAYLQGGVTWSEEETRRAQEKNEASGKVSGRFKFPLGSLLGMDVGAEAAGATARDSSVENTAARHHTVASLFNALYQYLHEDDQVVTLTSVSQLAELEAGQLVEVTGEYLGNPLAAVLSMLQQILPYMEEPEEAEDGQPSGPRTAPRSKQKGGSRTPPRMPDGQELAQQFIETALLEAQKAQTRIKSRACA